MKENLDSNQPHTKFCYVQQSEDERGRKRATLNILNPDSGLSEQLTWWWGEGGGGGGVMGVSHPSLGRCYQR